MQRHTEVSIRGDEFLINGHPTYEGRTWEGHRIQGLLLNSRMVQGIFDDLNPLTVHRWAYPDTGRWDAERNSREFIAAMPAWRRKGLLAFTINLQGGSPEGYSHAQPWHNSAITEDGELRPEYMARLARILDRADALGMVAILGIFYFGQDERLRDESAVTRALDNAVDWILARGYRNVLIEVNNECNVRYDHPILQPPRVHELIERVRARSAAAHRLLVGTSYGGGTVPGDNVVRASDFLLMHGNGVADPGRIAEMVRAARRLPSYRPMPILFNEDDHFDFDRPANNMAAAIGESASWGYFDPGANNYRDGYQSPPVRWGINTARKRAFFDKVAEVTGAGARVSRPALPKTTWRRSTPEAVGLDRARLDALRDLVGGRGCVVRHGRLAYTWGDETQSGDVASAVKPVISTLLLLAVQSGKLASADARVADVDPRLNTLNGGKDGAITWRHLASQTSGYGLSEPPGAAYAYNDYALALYYDELLGRVYQAPGDDVFGKLIAGPLGLEDRWTFESGRPGRLSVSVRDFARFGLLYLKGGMWGRRRILHADLVRMALGSPIDARLPRTSGREADMLPGQRTLGGGKDQTATGPGFYSFNWWLNGLDADGHRLFAAAPPDTFVASGHGGKRNLWVIPSLDLIVSWNDSVVDDHDASPHDPNTKCNRAARLVVEAVTGK